uniref:Uncharacterized protein n=1 Tax=Lepeophtheirus salmonis TaxID=72036 RepID=A0A0K2V533_LEPSM
MKTFYSLIPSIPC